MSLCPHPVTRCHESVVLRAVKGATCTLSSVSEHFSTTLTSMMPSSRSRGVPGLPGKLKKCSCHVGPHFKNLLDTDMRNPAQQQPRYKLEPRHSALLWAS